jgi:hypothetical protein
LFTDYSGISSRSSIQNKKVKPFLLSADERDELVKQETQAEKWIRPFINAEEFLYGEARYCLWLVDCPPDVLRKMPHVLERVEKVRVMREASSKASTRERANTPTLFAEIRQPKTRYLLIPKTSSEHRQYIPIGYLSSDVVCGDVFATSYTTLHHFGILTSTMHMAWARYTCGRLTSDYRYSAGIVYNNYPWPDEPADKQRAAVEAAAQAVLDGRVQFPQSSFADLYDPLTMPPALVKAHQDLDRAVDACYRKSPFTSDALRVEFLFERYQRLTSLLPSDKKTKGWKSTPVPPA